MKKKTWKNCRNCQKSFPVAREDQKFCSPSCRTASWQRSRSKVAAIRRIYGLLNSDERDEIRALVCA